MSTDQPDPPPAARGPAQVQLTPIMMIAMGFANQVGALGALELARCLTRCVAKAQVPVHMKEPPELALYREIAAEAAKALDRIHMRVQPVSGKIITPGR